MKIKKIIIQNFRSIQYLEIYPSSLYGIIGPNSAGKSNILRAIDLVLWDSWMTKNKVEKELFYDTSRAIHVQIEFDEPILWRNYSDVIQIKVATIEMSLSGWFQAKWRLWTSVDKTDKKGDWYWLNEEFKQLCNFIYIASDRQFDKQFNASSWTMMGKIMKEIHYAYIKKYWSEDALKNAFEEKMKEAKEFLENDFSEEDITFAKFISAFKDHCDENSFWMAQSFEPRLEIYDPNMFYRTLQIFLNEDGPRSFHIGEVWSWMQNMVLIAIFQTFAKLMKNSVIFGIEEPELFLYPHAQRSLYETFKELSESWTQILYTTHNPNFLDVTRPHQVLLIEKNATEWTISKERARFASKPMIDEALAKALAHFSQERSELFFAKKVLLVEGISDKIFFTRYLKEVYDCDINKLWISIIECSGKTGVLYFIGVCRWLGINYFSIWDRDSEVITDQHGLFTTSISEWFWLELIENLESFLVSEWYTLPNSGNKKIQNALEIMITKVEELNPIATFLNIEEVAIAKANETPEQNSATNDVIPF